MTTDADKRELHHSTESQNLLIAVVDVNSDSTSTQAQDLDLELNRNQSPPNVLSFHLSYGTSSHDLHPGKSTNLTNNPSKIQAKNQSRRHSLPTLTQLSSERISNDQSRVQHLTDLVLHPHLDDTLDSVFSSVRSISTEDFVEENCDSKKYLYSSVVARAFPERFFALLVTLLVELPTLFMISGGSDRLCFILGRTKYQLLVAFLPLTSAISGNCGLQCSTLTTRAVSHTHVTKNSYTKWLNDEIAVAFLLGTGMGAVLGTFAYVAAGNDIVFGTTIAIAQVLSILTAGLTGTLAPLIFTFIFHQDSGKWGGPLETAIQDIVGSFAMVVLSYYLLMFLGTGPVSPEDMCRI